MQVLKKSELKLEGAVLIAMTQRMEPGSIHVTNIPAGKHDDHIKMLFENEKRTGGKNISMYKRLEDGTALIVYEQIEGMLNY